MPEDHNTSEEIVDLETAIVADADETEATTPIAEETQGDPPAQPAPSSQSPTESPNGQVTGLSAEDKARAIAMITAANPDVVPELIQGDTLAELEASLAPARAAYARIAGSLAINARVPAGTDVSIDVSTLSPSAKIAEGLRRRSSTP